MKFQELHELVPYARFGKVKSLTMTPYKSITLAMPGRHAEDCTPKGGDFVVMVTDAGMKWKRHQFTHDDIFNDIEAKSAADKVEADVLMDAYFAVIIGEDPDHLAHGAGKSGINPLIFLHAVQCLAVAEHRRYAHYEDKFGGRFLPFRFATGIAEGLWTAADAIKVQKYGRPAVERLEKSNGTPVLTQNLFTHTP